MSKLRETLTTAGGRLLMIAFSAIPLLLLIALFKKMEWIATVLLPISGWVGVIALLFVPLLLLLGIPRVVRPWAGLGLILVSYAVGISLWLWCLVLAYILGGVFWMIVGICFGGIGVVPIAAIAALLNGEWLILVELVVGVIVVFGLRAIGSVWVETEPKTEYFEEPPEPPNFTAES